MRFDAIYIFAGRPELRTHLTRLVDAEFADALCARICYSSVEGGRTAWTDADHTLQAKLTFLASLGQWDPFTTDDGFRSIFGDVPKDEHFFDQGWTIDRLDIEGDIEHLAREHTRGLSCLSPSSNPLVRSWVQAMTQQNSSKD